MAVKRVISDDKIKTIWCTFHDGQAGFWWGENYYEQPDWLRFAAYIDIVIIAKL